MVRWPQNCGMLLFASVIGCSFDFGAALHFWTLADIFAAQRSLTQAHIVDSQGYNVLMRLGNPAVYSFLNGPNFSFPELTSLLSQKAGNFFPGGPFQLVDVSLLGKPSEKEFVELEWKTFASRPLDQLLHWPVHGVMVEDFQRACKSRGVKCPDTMQPGHMSKKDRFKLGKDHKQWDMDHFEEHVQALHALVTDQGSTPKVVFFHSIDGCDRTGALFAAYALRYRNRSLTEAIAENELIAKRHMSYRHQVAAQWYCEYLIAQGLYTHGYDCGNCAPYRCFDSGDPRSFFDSESVWKNMFLLGTVALLLSRLRKPARQFFSKTCSTGKLPEDLGQASTPATPGTTPPTKAPPSTPPPVSGMWRRRDSYMEDDYMLLSA